MLEHQVPAGEFKTHCLHLLDEVERSGVPLLVTKRGRPVARIVPVVNDQPASLLGCMRGMVTIQGDLVEATGENWEADAE